MTHTGNAIELRGVCKQYLDFTLKNLSFVLPQGTIMGYIGENGAGKTTTIKAILNLINLNGGEISVLGHDHIKEERQAKEEIGVVLDSCYFNPIFRAKEVNSILKDLHRNWDEKQFKSYCQQFRLPPDKKIKDYSKGMLMKLGIASALSHKPKILILDEATSGLDPVMRDQILDILLEFIQNEEHTVLLSSHITSDLEKVADYITFIHDGEIVFSKTKDDLLYQYGVLKCGREEFARLDQSQIVGSRENAFGVEALIRNKPEFQSRYRDMVIDTTTIEDIMVYYGKEQAE